MRICCRESGVEARGGGDYRWVGNDSLCEEKNCMRVVMEVSGCGLRGAMERELRKCPGKALMKAVARLGRERSDSK